MIYNLIGQPHSGKTTLAKHLKTALEINNPQRKALIIDGDDLRKILNNKDYSKEGRKYRANVVFPEWGCPIKL